jgi:ABC-type transport system involved in multi-copper enzyme maturation permease subunit
VPSPLRSAALVAWGVLLETARRKEFYVLFIFAAAFALFVLAARIVGIENPETGTFFLNLGLTFAWGAAHLLVILTAARQIPGEKENRTLYPLLARPLSRTTYLLGKWIACTAAGIITLLLLDALVWIPAPKLEYYSPVMMLQMLALHFVSLGATAAIVLTLSLFLPQAVNLVVSVIIVAFGQKISGFIANRAADSALEDIVRWFANYIPNFQILNLTMRYTDGITPLGVGPFLGLVLYGVIISLAAYAIAATIFRRQPL